MWRIAVLLLVLPNMALADMSSMRPRLRSDPVTVVPHPRLRPNSVAMEPALITPPRPRLRPDSLAAPVAMASAPPRIRPRLRPQISAPKALEPVAMPVALNLVQPRTRPDTLSSISAPKDDPSPRKKPPRKGSVCGNRAIRGVVLDPITSPTKGCGIDEPVRITQIDGIILTPAATLNCGTAKALETWITQAVEPVFGRGQVVQFQVAASYACRGRNNVKGARVSEHGRGNAIDIAAFVFKDGSSKSVLHDYDKTLRKVHHAACGIFGTTLGPGSDGYHENHIHLDIARYRGGSYCH